MRVSRAFWGLATGLTLLTGGLGGVASAADKIVVAAFRANLSMPVMLAMDGGAFATEGLDVQMVPFDNSASGSMALVAGDVDIASMSFSAAGFNLAGKGALRVIAGTVREEPGYHLTAYVVSNKAYDAGVRSPRDLKGMTIGLTTVGSPLHYSMAELARKYDFDFASMHFLQMHTMSAISAALQAGKIDAAVLLTALAQRAEREGFGHIVGWVGDETPGQYGGLFVATGTLAKKRPLIERFLRAYRAGTHIYYDAFLRRDASGNQIRGKDYDRLIDVIAKGQGVNRNYAMAMVDAYNDPEARLDATSVKAQIRFYQSLGMVDKSVDPASVIDASFGTVIEGKSAK